MWVIVITVLCVAQRKTIKMEEQILKNVKINLYKNKNIKHNISIVQKHLYCVLNGMMV